MKQMSCWGFGTAGLLAAAATSAFGCGPAPDYYDDVVAPHEVAPPPAAQEPIGEAEAATPAPSHNDRGSALFGTWTGTGHQNDGTSWAMEVDITRSDEGPCATVRYPDLGCAGFWTCTADEHGGLRAVERITLGERCADHVAIDAHVTRSGELIFHAATGDIRAEGRLQRAEQ